MNYTTHEVAQKLGMTKDTLFYYEKEGLLPQIERDEMNRQIYSESDISIFLSLNMEGKTLYQSEKIF